MIIMKMMMIIMTIMMMFSKYDDGDNLGFGRLTTNLIIMRMMVLIMEIMMMMVMVTTQRK